MNLEQINKVYFIGIGGIGMSAIARFFKSRGCAVAGYDRFETALTAQLLAEGIAVTYTDSAAEIPAAFRSVSDDLLVVYTPSVPVTTAVHQFFIQGKFSLYKRAQVLGFISLNHKVLAVAGTHGKTTTSIMLAHLLKSAGIAVSAFLGGISVNYNTNYIGGDSEWVVVEADEYDRSFLTLYPAAAVITSMDADHLDIYGDLSAMNESYNQFASQVDSEGLLLVHTGLPVVRDFISYGTGPDAAVRAENIRVQDRAFYFDYHDQGRQIPAIRMKSPGVHNIENATAAMRLAATAGLTDSQLKAGIESFSGVKRRFEYIVSTSDHVYIDDYAHHHEELRALVHTLKLLYPDKPLTLVFQPHLFSRTRDFFREMAAVLSQADTLILLEIYPAREEPIVGISSALILNEAVNQHRFIMSKDELLRYVKENRPVLLVTAGAGDIDSLVSPLGESLSGERSIYGQH